MGFRFKEPSCRREKTGGRWAALFAFWLMAGAAPAFAYRPFDLTEADVAAEGEYELELGPVGYLREGSAKFLIAPAVVGNLGIAAGREIVLEGKLSTPLNDAAGSQSVLEDSALSLKQIHRRGSLQDGTGVSIASECGVLLPEVHGESGTGASCFGIASQRWSSATVHLNIGLALDREHNWNRTLGGIVEGPHEWIVRPALELIAQRNSSGSRTNSALAGVIWQAREDLAFDFGVRSARSDGQDVYEIRAGLTWGFSLRNIK